MFESNSAVSYNTKKIGKPGLFWLKQNVKSHYFYVLVCPFIIPVPPSAARENHYFDFVVIIHFNYRFMSSVCTLKQHIVYFHWFLNL